MPVLKCHCLEAHTTCRLGKAGKSISAQKHVLIKKDAKRSMSFSVMCIEATECSFLFSGWQSQKNRCYTMLIFVTGI